MMRWTRTCTITDVEPDRLLVFRTHGGYPPDSTEWRFDLAPTPAGGTRITQSFRIIAMPRYLELTIVLFLPPHRDRRSALADDLVRLGEVAARTQGIHGGRMGTRPHDHDTAEPVEDPEVVPSGDPSPIETPDPPATPQPGPDES